MTMVRRVRSPKSPRPPAAETARRMLRRLLLFALEVNYPDFFDLAGNFVKRRQPAAESTSPSPNT